ncbi:MAG: DUF3311 domain-containing protein [Actinomycetota bacterium]|nr:DUF3311 domain-containing protein [Actinomycetota bacterium]
MPDVQHSRLDSPDGWPTTTETAFLGWHQGAACGAARRAGRVRARGPAVCQRDPALAGIPFFFWFQFALIPVSAVMTGTAFLVTSKHERDHRRQR